MIERVAKTDELKKLKAKYLDEGTTAKCYLTETGEVYKSYYGWPPNINQTRFISQYYDSDIFVFPKEFIYEDEIKDEKCIGNISDYIKGDLFKDIKDEENIHRVLESLKILEKEMGRLTRFGILLTDLNPANIIYTPDKTFRVIDTDYYQIEYDEFYMGGIIRENTKELASSVISVLYKENDKRFSDRLAEIIFECGARANISNTAMLQRTLDAFDKKHIEVNTVGEFKRELKRL